MKDLPCPPALWPRFSTRLDEVLALDAAARDEWLNTLPPHDAELKPWLAAVLSADAQLSTREALQRPRLAASSTADEHASGQRLGPWRLHSPLGSGGMGSVWRAERADGAYTREVALKLPHAHLLSGALQARFARERDILSALEHPHIARFYDAGLADLTSEHPGQPWLALELVEGEAITRHCERLNLGVEARLELVQQMAAAVQAAHARLIVHRDLKPANVLVTPEGRVKLLDFGIAKLLGDDDSSALTQATGRAATPDYAAPEQLNGGVITVATDVFALGAMLFELLTGTRPFAARSALAAAMSERGDAPLASTRAPAARQAALRGDLDAICAKALDPDPAKRYASVEGFAADLSRHRAHLPITARRITRRQRAGKFIRRHRAPLGFAALLLVVLAAGITGVLWQAREARQQAARAEAVKNFLIDIFKASDPRIASERPRGSITARELLDLGADRVEREFASDPRTQAELYGVITDMVLFYGHDAKSEAMQAKRLELGRKAFGPDHEVTLLWWLFDLSRAVNRSDFDAAAAGLATISPHITQGGHDDGLLRAQWWISHEAVLTYRDAPIAERRHALDEAIRLLEAHAPDHIDYGTAIANRATNAYHAEDYATARADTEKAIAGYAKATERNDLQLAAFWGNLGNAQLQLGEMVAAEKAYAEATRLLRATGTLGDGWYWRWEASHARALHLMGERPRARAMFAALMPQIPKDWKEYPDDAFAYRLYGERLVAEGADAEAVIWLQKAITAYAKPGSYPPELPNTQLLLALALARQGEHEAARTLLAQAQPFMDDPARQPRADHLGYRLLVAETLEALGDLDAARAVFETILKLGAGRALAPVALAEGGLSRLALAEGRVGEAEQRSQAALALWAKVSGWRDVRAKPLLQRIRAEGLLARGELAAAQALEDEAAAASARFDDPQSATVRRRVLKRP